MNKTETIRYTDGAIDAFPLVSCCYICDAPYSMGETQKIFRNTR